MSRIICLSKSSCATARASFRVMDELSSHNDKSSGDVKRSAWCKIQWVSCAPLKHLRWVCRSCCSWCIACSGMREPTVSFAYIKSPEVLWQEIKYFHQQILKHFWNPDRKKTKQPCPNKLADFTQTSKSKDREINTSVNGFYSTGQILKVCRQTKKSNTAVSGPLGTYEALFPTLSHTPQNVLTDKEIKYFCQWIF